jgi:predicted nucleic acid-binding protein
LIYLDSSILLEAYTAGPRSPEAVEILERAGPKAASWLLMVEVPIVLRRTLHRPRDRAVLTRALDRFDADLKRIGLVDSLTDVALRVRSDPRFSRCRSLDAVHACTALLLREWTGHAVRIETFDDRLRALAEELHLR